MHDRRKKARPASRSPFSPSRCIGLAFAMSGHLALFLLLLGPASPTVEQKKMPPSQSNRGALSARLISRVPPAKASPARPWVPSRMPPIRVSSRLPRRPSAMNPLVVAPTPPVKPTALPAPNAGHSLDYIPGGRSFGTALLPGMPPATRLPGGVRVKGAPSIRMVDPRSQGMAGVARFLQGLTGAADPACVDADAWNTMSEEERIARHKSATDVARIATEHNCPLPPSQRGHQ